MRFLRVTILNILGRKPLTPLFLLIVLFLLLGSTTQVHAATTIDQCKANPKLSDCVSFDPAVNPILSRDGLTYNSSSNGKIYTNSQGLKCVDYTGPLSAFYAPSTGCVGKDGIFRIDGVDVATAVAGAAATGGAVATPADLTQTTATGTQNIPLGEASNSSCTFGLGGDLKSCLVSIMGYVVAAVESVILFIASGILGLANYLLGWTVYITIYQFGNLVGNSEGLLDAWGVVRDVGNILLLFGFIFMGIATILNLPHSEYTAKKALPTLVIFAILLNFSLVAVEGVIDVSNAFATSIYDQIGGGMCGDEMSSFDCALNGGIGGRVMQMSGIASIFSMSSESFSVFGEAGNGVTAAVVYGGLIIFVVLTTIVLFAAAIMLLIRALVLAFLMVTSPIGFAGMAIPPLQETAKQWWDQLIHQSLFAPIYFLLVLISLKVMEGVIDALGGSQTADMQNLAAVFVGANADGRASNVTIAITFALIIGFMIAALMFAKKSSAIGSGMAIKAGGAFAFGGLGFAGRQTVGRASLMAATRIGASRSMMNSVGGRTLFRLANKGAGSSFDFRQTDNFARKGLGTAVGDLGTVRKSVQHGMHGIEEDKQKKKVEFAKNIKQSHDESQRQDKLEEENRREQAARQREENQRRQDEAPLLQRVTDQENTNATNAAARAQNIAGVQAQLNQAVANGQDATAFQNQLNILLAQNQQELQAEQNELQARRDQLRAHRDATNQALAEYDRRIARNNTEINGGEFEGQQFAGITADAKRKRYGESLRNSVLSRHASGFTIAGHTDYEAGREVIRNAGRTGVDRAVRDLQNALGSGGGGGAANAPAPAAGGHGGGGGHRP